MYQKFSRYILAGVPLLGALMACSSESAPGDDPAGKDAVQFRASEVASRATLITGDNITSHDFAVWGDMVSNANASTAAPTTLFNGTEVTYSGSGAEAGWKYGYLEYWMPSHTYSFVALYPSDAVNAVNYSGSQLSFDYTYPAQYDDAQDMLISVHRRKYAFGKGENTVAFKFHHILSRLNFIANLDPAAVSIDGFESVVINSVSLKGVGTEASFSISPALIASGAELGYSTDDSNESLTSLWTTPSESTYGIIFEVSDPAVTLNSATRTHSYFPSNTNPLMVIPQVVSADVEVTVDYTVNYSGSTPSRKIVTSKLQSAAIAAHDGYWLPGQSYTYNFTLGAEDRIIFSSPVMEDWDESEGANFII